MNHIIFYESYNYEPDCKPHLLRLYGKVLTF